MRRETLGRVLGIMAQVVWLGACSPPNALAPPPVSAEQPFNGPQCTAGRPQKEPDLMAWDPASRGALAAVRRQGVAVVHYEANGCDVHLELLANCIANGKYDFVPYWESDSKVARNANELFAKLPIGAAGLATKLQGNRAIRADYMLAGMVQIPIGVPYHTGDLVGECSRATHVVSRMYIGAFALASGESRELSGSASLFVQAGASSQTSTERLQDGGDPKSCETSRKGQVENGGCAVPLRLTLMSLAQARACSEPTECEARCTGGDTTSCNELAGMYLNGKGVPQDLPRAAVLFRQSCDAGDPLGCGDLGNAYLRGAGVTADFVRGMDLLGQACNRGVPWGCGGLASAYENGMGVPPDLARAADLYQRACSGGDAPSCGRSIALGQAACDGGDGNSCQNLAMLYAKGRGVPKDMKLSLALFEQACSKGVAVSCVEAGGFYLESNVVKRDPARARAFFEKVCSGMTTNGCISLGAMYMTGDGVRKDLARARALFDQSCDGGDDPDGCAALGSLYEDGKGVRTDVARATVLYKQSCDRGSPKGCGALGSLYEEGKGVPANPTRALSLYKQSCDGGEEDACRAFERLNGGH